MTQAIPAQAGATEDAFAIGETVLVTRGLLIGLRGTVSGFAADHRCILTIAGVSPGAKVVIGTDALEPMDVIDPMRRIPR